jgi:SNF2 family DNA or RNA helicase
MSNLSNGVIIDPFNVLPANTHYDVNRRLDDTNTSLKNSQHCQDCAAVAAKGRSASNSDLPPESAKIRMVLKLLRDIEDRGEGEKTIVFSQFTSMLDLIQSFLKDAGLKYVRCECLYFSLTVGIFSLMV